MRHVYEIGELRLDADARVLTHGGAPVALGARGVAVLTALVNRAGEYVPKADIMDAAWPGVVVEEANLAVQVSAIRRALARLPGGDAWIETRARRGYRFVGPVVASAGRAPESPTAFDRTHTNLPQVLTSFVGREREIAELKQLLPTTRLLTLTGTGGIGKTRLALQAAAEVIDAFRDGVWFVDLAPVLDPALVCSAAAQVLGVKESAGEPLLKTLCDHLRTKEMLLVLDNCEHVVGASADLVDALLRETPRVSVVATSRESLRVGAERSFPLGALALPGPNLDAAAIARTDAVRLFIDRARQHRPNFDLQEQRASAVGRICVRLDGIPLALELAAARVAVLPVDQILRLLDQRFRLLVSGNRDLPRQQTLHAMIDWSYDLLDESERLLLARLSVFSGGWTITSAQIVGAGEPLSADQVVHLLISLVDRSLVVADEDGDRYRMLETIRQYADEKLTATGAEEVRARHLDHFVALAVEAEPKLTGAEQTVLLKRLDQEYDNLRAALNWSLLAGTTEGMRLCGVLQRFWFVRGYFSEGRAWCARVLNKPGAADVISPDRANALNSLGALTLMQGEYPAARAAHAESLAIRRQLGDRRGTAKSLTNLGIVAYFQGDYAVARATYEEALALQRELGVRESIANTLGNLGTVEVDLGNFEAAQARYEEALAIMRESQNLSGIAKILSDLGTVVAHHQRDIAAARRLMEESLAISRELGARQSIANALSNLGDLAFLESDYARAAALHRECLAIQRAMVDRSGIASSLAGLAAVAAALGAPLSAARIWGAADHLRHSVGSPLPPRERPRYEHRVAAARAAVGDDAAFNRVWQEGSGLALDEAMDLAMEESVAHP